MNISAPYAGITPQDGAAPASRLEDVPPIDLKNRDPDYYRAPLIILVSPVLALHHTLI
jgi:hypothetical protein